MVLQMFQLCVWLLELAFVVGIIVGGSKASLTWSKYTMVGVSSFVIIFIFTNVIKIGSGMTRLLYIVPNIQ